MADRIKLTQISSHSFVHPDDRAALEALKKTVGFERLMRAIAKFGMDKIWHIVNESSNIRLSEMQVGSVYKLHTRTAEILDIEPPPLYLQHDVRVNAYTAGVQEPFIVVTSGLVEGFTDGFDALSKIADHRPDLIFVDIMMPRLDGYQTCSLIKHNRNFRDIPVIMLSSKDGLFDRARGRIVGSEQYLTKPFTKDELLGAIASQVTD